MTVVGVLLSLPQARELAAGLEKHTDPARGVSNTVLDRVARLVLTSSYKGLFSVDRIPAGVLSLLPNFCIIVNLARTGKADSHFVTLVAEPDKIRYLDSFALKETPPELASFIRSCGRRTLILTHRPVQSRSVQTCALYALLFAAYFDPLLNLLDFSLMFHRRRLMDNDALCVRYLRKVVDGRQREERRRRPQRGRQHR